MAVQLACREGSARLEVRGIRAREEWGPQTGKGSPGGRGEGTHLKHVFHVLDAGEVEVQRLVELLRVLPSRKEGEVWAGRREGGGRGGGASGMKGRARLEVRGKGTHSKHVGHACDAGRFEAQLLVECRRALPSCKGSHAKRGEVWAVRRWARWWCKPRAGKGSAGG